MTGAEHGRNASADHAIGDAPKRAIAQIIARLPALTPATRLALIGFAGSIALAIVAFVCVQAGANFATAAFALLIVIAVLSLFADFASLILFSVIAGGCLNLLFVQPRFSVRMSETQDLIALVMFIVASLVVAGLVRRVPRAAGAQHEQDQLRAIIDTVPVIVWSTHPNGENDFHNYRLLSYTGFSAHQALGTGWVEMFHPDDIERHYNAWKRAVETEASFESESRLRRFDGQYRWFLARAEPLRDQHGKIVKWYGTNVDIDDRKRAEQALRRSEAHLAEAQRLSHTGSFGWDLSTHSISWSEEMFRIFDCEPTENPSVEMILRRVHPDDIALVKDVVERISIEREDIDFEHRLLMPDGSIKCLHVVAHRMAGDNDSQHLVGAVMDITAQKRAYADLERSEKRYRHLFNHMPLALYQLDGGRIEQMLDKLRAEGVTDLIGYLEANPDFQRACLDALIVEEINERAVQMLGGDTSDFVGAGVGWAWEAAADTIRRALASRYRGENHFEEETKMVTRDGRTVDVLFSSSRITDLAMSLIGIVDISERIRAQDMLSRVQADFAHAARVSVLGELTASIAHEVNQPLAAIAANGEVGLRWLARPDPDLAELRELAESVVADARRAADIIARIRTMAARKPLGQEPVLLDDVIRETLVFLRHEVQSRAVTVSHFVCPTAVKVLADRTQLQQVIVNLMVNAMQAMAQAASVNRKISIRTMVVDPTTVRCVIADSGPGIEADHFARLFDSFFTTKQGGMGMGLPICRSIIEAHGGRIDAENGPEGGARFTLTLPIAA
jgi:PAS domain S-box-containing protein